jgi:hypothetical protein
MSFSLEVRERGPIIYVSGCYCDGRFQSCQMPQAQKGKKKPSWACERRRKTLFHKTVVTQYIPLLLCMYCNVGPCKFASRFKLNL